MRKILTLKETDEILIDYYPTIVKAIGEGFNDYLDLLNCIVQKGHMVDFRPRTIASIVNDFVKGRIKDNFYGVPGVVAKDFNEVFGLFIDNKLFIRFKKINPDFSTSNIPTKQTIDFINQQQISGFPDKPTFLFAGYMPDASWSILTNIYLLCKEGERIIWLKDLNDIRIEQRFLDFTETVETLQTKRVKVKSTPNQTGTNTK